MSWTLDEKEKISKSESGNVKTKSENNLEVPTTYVKQCIKVQNHHDDNVRGGKFFTIAHLYLTSASLARENSKITLTGTTGDQKLEKLSNSEKKRQENELR
jgi:CRISPR/Cas system CMR-associated protein Cmr1 (group 7 of RAMP superfamily)